ncbi:L-lactate dehydrogenase complex protein LldG [Thermosporothrix hazakensis]|jgi:L-lactate dehydrogenase complex protein LldG|uniref:L-lactate dehydrogenase complex protein LldG n=1 Tax=Thermosporothrix hazakensis TaxID=644383 RepID=A0A326U8C7_THEHA|nr:lactate utilization protein [Thermosporothrix hazakensis]PZW31986.1 L-lactate dehydrogenase complex protein LldG [Thermosporothrix hazakensis]GCE49688.1 hypothetical protein KTH_45570 [Thermosporothrix hazakensis]
MDAQELYLRFQHRLTASGGECWLVEDLAAAANTIASHSALTGRTLVVPPGFADCALWGALLPLLAAKEIQISEAETPAGIADAPAGLSAAELAVAETGSVLVADNVLAARAVSMLTLTHFVLVRVEDLVPGLDQVGERLYQLTRPGPTQRHHMTLISGPSRTADIERTLTIGVQGPKALCVLLVAHQEVQP